MAPEGARSGGNELRSRPRPDAPGKVTRSGGISALRNRQADPEFRPLARGA